MHWSHKNRTCSFLKSLFWSRGSSTTVAVGPVKLGQLNDWKLHHEDQCQHIWGVPKMENTQKHGFKRLITKTLQFIWNDLGVPISGDLIWIHLGDHPLMVYHWVWWIQHVDSPWHQESHRVESGFRRLAWSYPHGKPPRVGSQRFVGYIMAIWYISWLFGYSFYMFLYVFIVSHFGPSLFPLSAVHSCFSHWFIVNLLEVGHIWILWVMDVTDIKCYCMICITTTIHNYPMLCCFHFNWTSK